ncbi:peptidyl-prolyl cis-trans isomerase [Hydrocarboniphaga sp.]|uniref:peptidylprolyl isomerase n=1 Tax=Hydrocarboniphaga sp. TaxID=2033016 RepID=UPI003D10ACBE
MTTSLQAKATDRPHAMPSKLSRFPGWMREPLLHFVLLGGVLFAADHVISGRDGDPNLIVVDEKVDTEARDVFEKARGRAPNDDELYALRKVWLDNEVLYREGLKMQVDRGDPAIRDRVIFKALSNIDASVKMPPITDDMLKAWLEKHRDKYDEPTRYDFHEAVLGGERSESTARAFAEALNRGQPGDSQAGLRVFTGRPLSNIEQSYGSDFAKALTGAAPAQWQALPSKDGWHVVQLSTITPGKAADFETLRGVLSADLTDATLAEQRSAAVRALAKQYTIKLEKMEPATP